LEEVAFEVIGLNEILKSGGYIYSRLSRDLFRLGIIQGFKKRSPSILFDSVRARKVSTRSAGLGLNAIENSPP
jgi:hypothetical protein